MAKRPTHSTVGRTEHLAILGTSAAMLLCGGCIGEIGGGSPTDHDLDQGAFAGLGLAPQPAGSCAVSGAGACIEEGAWADGEPEENACGGAGTLAQSPGSPCGACGQWACEGPEQVACDDPGSNACGGCAILSHEPLSSCGTCGARVCADDGESLSCQEQPTNACGGCTALSKPVGGACNTCGTWTCSGAEAVTCDEPQCLPCLAQNFDISQVGVWRGRSDARNWPVMSDLTVDVVGSWLYFDFDQPETWVGDGTTCSEFFVIYKDAGVWVAQVADYLGCDESQHQKYGFFDDWGPNNEWYRISPGDPVGFLVTSQSMSGGAHIPMYERTTVHMMCW